MTDLDTRLRDGLAAYANSVTPSPPLPLADLAAPPRASGGSRRPGRRTPASIAAAVLLVAAVPVIALVMRQSASPSVGPPAPLAAGTWRLVPDGPLAPRKAPSVVWSGREFIVWGGSNGNPSPLGDGAAFDPATLTWRTIASTPDAHPGAAAVWAGDRLVVLAGLGGEAYDPATDSWASLPSLAATGASTGFTDAVWTGDVLLGVGVDVSDDGRSAVLAVWTLDEPGARWEEGPSRTIRGGLPTTGRMVSVADQFAVFEPVATDDGFVLWNAAEGGWRYRIESGWERLPPLAVRKGRSIIDDTAVWWRGRLIAIASTMTADSNQIDIAELGADGWSAPQPVLDGWMGLPRAVAIDDGIVVLGAVGVQAGAPPLLVDPVAATAVALVEDPVDTAIEQGAAWSGEHLFVWGGQRSEVAGASTTDDPGPISADGALWTP